MESTNHWRTGRRNSSSENSKRLALLRKALNPLNWIRLLSGTYGRSDLASQILKFHDTQEATSWQEEEKKASLEQNVTVPGLSLMANNLVPASVGGNLDRTTDKVELKGAEVEGNRISVSFVCAHAGNLY